ncbi:MAG: SUMF1/EgtB/PvdO family nonheme iron enzyme [Luteolibacter sp.]
METEKDFGDYKVTECVAETRHTRTWLAEQGSVGRRVLIEELKDEALAECNSFLADARAKAAVEHPSVGSIYEASHDENGCFFAYELLPGETLAQRLEAGKKMPAIDFVKILGKIAEANIYHEEKRNATSLLDAGSVHIDEHGVVRVANLAVAGERMSDHSLRDVMKLGRELEPLPERGMPGASRCLTLLAWMRGEEVLVPLTWEAVLDYCGQIEQQLTEPSDLLTPPTRALRPAKKGLWIWGVAALIAVVPLGAFFLMPKGKKPSPVKTAEAAWVKIPKGQWKTPDNLPVKVAAFRIAETEVTIGQYADFLETLELLTGSGGDKTFDHANQPQEKKSHVPDDWSALFAAAKSGEQWNDREVTLNTPVVGVDWWDAYAYAKWKRGFLPTLEQWLAAVLSGAKHPSGIPVSEWLPVTEDTLDRTNNGVVGLAGSVSEWTSEPRKSPSNPLGDALWVIAGGSYLKPGKGALNTDYVPDRMLRRPDLGFRICETVK